MPERTQAKHASHAAFFAPMHAVWYMYSKPVQATSGYRYDLVQVSIRTSMRGQFTGTIAVQVLASLVYCIGSRMGAKTRQPFLSSHILDYSLIGIAGKSDQSD